nr:gustatory receptor 21 [Papilio xuthus]
MSFPNVHIDTYISDMSKPNIDTLSKIYIIANWLIGINWLPVAFKIQGVYKILSFVCTFLMNVIIVYVLIIASIDPFTSVVVIIVVTQYFVCSFVAVSSSKNLKKFYNELWEFDKDIKMNRGTNTKARINFTLAILLFSVFIIGVVSDWFKKLNRRILVLIFMYINNIVELFYYGHLFSLLEIRLRTIRILLLSSFPHVKRLHSLFESEGINFDDEIVCKLISRNSKIEIKKLSNLYYKIIKAYDFLNAAIRWQLFFIFAVAFITLVSFLDHTALQITDSKFTWDKAIPSIAMTVLKLLPLMVPCLFGQAIHYEVSLLRTALKSRINNVFDTTSCRFAKLFIELIQIRSLTFSVFRMIEINTTFPFKFIGLAVSYLLIILQFQKVKIDNH